MSSRNEAAGAGILHQTPGQNQAAATSAHQRAQARAGMCSPHTKLFGLIALGIDIIVYNFSKSTNNTGSYSKNYMQISKYLSFMYDMVLNAFHVFIIFFF